MDYYQQKYNQQRIKNENMLKLQKTMFSDTEQFMKVLLRLQDYIHQFKGQATIDECEEITPSDADILVDQVIAILKKSSKACECDRWKKLYQRESDQTLKLSQFTQQLSGKIKEKEQQQQIDRVEINQLLNDYLELYKKQFYVPNKEEKEEKETEKKREKKEPSRSKSKGKMGVNQSQTQRKNTKNVLGCEMSPKDENYVKMIIQKMERDLSDLHKEVEELRDQNMEKQQLIRIYRAKERKQLLYGSSFD